MTYELSYIKMAKELKLTRDARLRKLGFNPLSIRRQHLFRKYKLSLLTISEVSDIDFLISEFHKNL